MGTTHRPQSVYGGLHPPYGGAVVVRAMLDRVFLAPLTVLSPWAQAGRRALEGQEMANGLKLAAPESAIGRDSKPARFRPYLDRTPTKMRTEKHGENRKNVPEKRRTNGTFSGTKAPFSPCSQPTSPRLQAANKLDLMSYKPPQSHAALGPTNAK